MRLGAGTGRRFPARLPKSLYFDTEISGSDSKSTGMKPNDWSKAVIARDRVCVDCGVGAPLHAHHIKPKSTHPDLKFDLSNGAAVCPTCHWKRHEAERMPRSQAMKRGPQRKTLERQVAYLTAIQRSASFAEQEREIRMLKEENRRLRRLLRAFGLTRAATSR